MTKTLKLMLAGAAVSLVGACADGENYYIGAHEEIAGVEKEGVTDEQQIADALGCGADRYGEAVRIPRGEEDEFAGCMEAKGYKIVRS